MTGRAAGRIFCGMSTDIQPQRRRGGANPLDEYSPDVPVAISEVVERRYGLRQREGARLSPRQARFVTGYVAHGNKVRAMTEAGYEKANLGLADALLSLPEIAEAVDEQLAAIADLNRATHARILAEHARVALADITDFIPALTSEDANAAVAELPRSLTAAVKKLKITRTYAGRGEDREPVDTIELELHDKHKSLDALAKVTKLYETREEGDVDTPFGRLLDAALRKIEGRG